jgi:uncharacterized membrane protein YphA (DoxX/SURF4 family)
MKKTKIPEIVSFLVSLVFIYTGFSKYFNLDLFIHSMRSQPFPGWLAVLLIKILPAFEIIIAFLLLYPGTRRLGLYGAAILALAFTFYSWTAFFHLFSVHSPCPCGGMFSSFSWKQHIVFSTILLFLLVFSLTLAIKKQNKIVICV